MKAIIIGAGRGARLMPHTEDAPKCFAEVKGKRILDWGLEALRAGGFENVVFIGGYRIEMVRQAYPDFTYCHNVDWPNNNIMESLFHAEACMDEGFVCAYSDILYRPSTIEALMDSPHDITLVCDTAWRERYKARTEHPENDAEKMEVEQGRVIAVNRTMPGAKAHGEYIGVARFSPVGASLLRDHYVEAKAKTNGRPFHSASTFKKAYLIDLFQEMLDAGVPMHALDTHGGYMEIDTNQDFQIAREEWSL
ncbi:MAG: phosphocholine cytidylyltransferase family protein [Candidatus Hydrogenedentes bacterium]|nr:phosphocholine cytidylyltransferase family protein [Candidatus Hydrogenedentota bacterium]